VPQSLGQRREGWSGGGGGVEGGKAEDSGGGINPLELKMSTSFEVPEKGWS
jgi:hypothetical protein